MHFAPTSRLRAYSSAALGATAVLATHADAATVVPVNSATFDTTFSSLGTVSRGSRELFSNEFQTVAFTGSAAYTQSNYFHRGNDTATVIIDTIGRNSFDYAKSYAPGDTNSSSAALLNSDDNWFYAVGETDNSQRVWLQFQFGDGEGNGFSIVNAVYPDYEGELPSAFAAANAVPEPSALALLTLGASGLLARRRRNAA